MHPPRAAAGLAAASALLLEYAGANGASRPFAAAAASSSPPPPPPRKPRALPWTSSTFARTALPMFGFVVVAWFGLEQLIDSKLRIRAGVRGHDRLEEHDPLERLRRMAAEAPDAAGGGAAAAARGRRRGQNAGEGAEGAAKGAPGSAGGVPSLEEELEAMNRKLGDTRKFDYVPVPRTDEEE